MPTAVTTRSSSSRPGGARVAVGIGLSSAYCVAFLANAQALWPRPLRELGTSLSRWAYNCIAAGCDSLQLFPGRPELRSSLYLLLMAAAIPWLLLAVFGRGRPYDLGLRRPNRIGWRLLVVGYVLALPFLFWMTRGSEFSTDYLRQLQHAGTSAFLIFYFVNMLSEHFFFHGLLLATCRTGQRWPEPAPVATGATNGATSALRWLGMAQPTNHARGFPRLLRWVGLPSGCVPAVCASATLLRWPTWLIARTVGSSRSFYISRQRAPCA